MTPPATTPAAVVAAAPTPSSYQEVVQALEKAFAVAAPFESLAGAQVQKLMADLSNVVTDLAPF